MIPISLKIYFTPLHTCQRGVCRADVQVWPLRKDWASLDMETVGASVIHGTE